MVIDCLGNRNDMIIDFALAGRNAAENFSGVF
jgi:hypothetical protein